MTYHQQLENRLRDANRLILEQNEKLDEYRRRFQLHNEEYRMMNEENRKHLRCNEEQYHQIKRLREKISELEEVNDLIPELRRQNEYYGMLAETRGKGLVNIYSIANGGQKCEVEYALGLATGSVDRVVRQRDRLVDENERLLRFRDYIDEYFPRSYRTAIDNLKAYGCDLSMESNVSKTSPLCIPFSLDPLPVFPQVPKTTYKNPPL